MQKQASGLRVQSRLKAGAQYTCNLEDDGRYFCYKRNCDRVLGVKVCSEWTRTRRENCNSHGVPCYND